MTMTERNSSNSASSTADKIKKTDFAVEGAGGQIGAKNDNIQNQMHIPQHQYIAIMPSTAASHSNGPDNNDDATKNPLPPPLSISTRSSRRGGSTVQPPASPVASTSTPSSSHKKRSNTSNINRPKKKVKPNARCVAPYPPLNKAAASPALKVLRIRTPHPHDVLCGRGGGINSHPGNVTFRNWVRDQKELYNLASSKSEKARISLGIVDRVKHLNPPGRFLIRDGTGSSSGAGAGAGAGAGSTGGGTGGRGGGLGGWWVEIDESKAMAKTSQALREGAPSIRAMAKKVVTSAALKTDRTATNPTHTILTSSTNRMLNSNSIATNIPNQNLNHYDANSSHVEKEKLRSKKVPFSAQSFKKGVRRLSPVGNETDKGTTGAESKEIIRPIIVPMTDGHRGKRLIPVVQSTLNNIDTNFSQPRSTRIMKSSMDFQNALSSVSLSQQHQHNENSGKAKNITVKTHQDKAAGDIASTLSIEKSMATTPPPPEEKHATPALLPIPLSPDHTNYTNSHNVTNRSNDDNDHLNNFTLPAPATLVGGSAVTDAPFPFAFPLSNKTLQKAPQCKRSHSLALSDFSEYDGFDGSEDFMNPFENEDDKIQIQSFALYPPLMPTPAPASDPLGSAGTAAVNVSTNLASVLADLNVPRTSVSSIRNVSAGSNSELPINAVAATNSTTNTSTSTKDYRNSDISHQSSAPSYQSLQQPEQDQNKSCHQNQTNHRMSKNADVRGLLLSQSSSSSLLGGSNDCDGSDPHRPLDQMLMNQSKCLGEDHDSNVKNRIGNGGEKESSSANDNDGNKCVSSTFTTKAANDIAPSTHTVHKTDEKNEKQNIQSHDCGGDDALSFTRNNSFRKISSRSFLYELPDIEQDLDYHHHVGDYEDFSEGMKIVHDAAHPGLTSPKGGDLIPTHLIPFSSTFPRISVIGGGLRRFSSFGRSTSVSSQRSKSSSGNSSIQNQ